MPPHIYRLPFFPLLLCFFFIIPCFSLDQQVQTLFSWKSQLNISGSDTLSSWNVADASPCNWAGVKCNQRGEVSEIELKGFDLQLSPPVTILRSLKSLTSLTLSSLNLTGAIPKEIGDLSELKVLDLSDNSLSGEIPWKSSGSRNSRLCL